MSNPESRGILITFLVNNYSSKKRGPYRTDRALEALKAVEADANPTLDIQRTILNESELAWTVYVAGEKQLASSHIIAGQTQALRLLNAIKASAPLHSVFAKELRMALEGNVSAGKRAYSVTETNGSETTFDTTKRPCLTIENHMPTPSTLTPDNPGLTYANLNEHSALEGTQQGVYIGACLKESKKLFPIEFMDAIQRVTDRKDQ